MRTIVGIIAFFLPMFLAACNESIGLGQGDYAELVASQSLLVPTKYLYSVSERGAHKEGSTGGADVLIFIPNNDIKNELFNFIGRTTSKHNPGVLLRLSKLKPNELGESLKPKFFDDLIGFKGVYQGGKVSFNEAVGMYRVHIAGSENWWDYVAKDPRVNDQKLDFTEDWYANCQVNMTTARTSCSTKFVTGDILIEFAVAEEDVAQISGLKKLFTGLIEKFRNDASLVQQKSKE